MIYVQIVLATLLSAFSIRISAFKLNSFGLPYNKKEHLNFLNYALGNSSVEALIGGTFNETLLTELFNQTEMENLSLKLLDLKFHYGNSSLEGSTLNDFKEFIFKDWECPDGRIDVGSWCNTVLEPHTCPVWRSECCESCNKMESVQNELKEAQNERLNFLETFLEENSISSINETFKETSTMDNNGQQLIQDTVRSKILVHYLNLVIFEVFWSEISGQKIDFPKLISQLALRPRFFWKF